MRHPFAVLLLSLVPVASALAQQPKSTTKSTPALSSISTPRSDPYKNYRFRVSLGSSYVAGFSEFTQTGSALPSVSTTAAAAPNSGNSNNLGGNSALGGGVAGSSAAPNGVPVQVPGSLVGRSGTVTLICSAAPNSGVAAKAAVPNSQMPAGPETVTLICTAPSSSAGGAAQGAGIVGNNAVSTNVSPNAAKPPSPSKYDVIALRNGITQDSTFQGWVSATRSGHAQDLTVDVFNEAGQRTGGDRLHGCTVATFQGLPAVDSSSITMVVIALDLHCSPQ